MNDPPSDLAQCADEPIRVPGSIQPHGRMVVLGPDAQVVAHSANWADRAAAEAAVAPLRAHVRAFGIGEAPAPLGHVRLGDEAFEATGHRRGPFSILEFEPTTRAAEGAFPIVALARRFLPRLQRAESMDALATLAADEMKRLTGFGRALVYRFDEAGHGEVLAEAIDPGYVSYAGHRFPASDIPAQARELYLLNQFRVIPDAEYVPVPLVVSEAGVAATDIDLSLATLRSVSPVHVEYMRNMGTRASMSVSIVVRDKLWGLISCHDHEARGLDFQTRVACEHLGRLLSLQIEAKEDKAEVATRHELRKRTLEIVAHLADSDATLKRIVEVPDPLLGLAGATGAALVLNDECSTVGVTPDVGTVHSLARWIAQQGGPVWSTDRLSEVAPAFRNAVPHGAGVLAISISQVHRHMILWFRREIVQTIQWAGDPRKEVTAADGRIHPRRSFASWRELVRGRSSPWTTAEVSAVSELRQALLGIVLRRAEEMAAVATELGRVNKELEAFSYTVSHDLRAPMRHIAGYVDLVLDIEGKHLSERAHRYLAHVKEASAYAGELVDGLLDFSRMGRAELRRGRVDSGVLVDDLVREIAQSEPERQIEWTVADDLPTVWADPFLLKVAVRNLLSNAVKYTRGRTPARISVTAVDVPAGEGIEVADNGVGFQMKYVAKLFGVFQRLHQAEEFEGTGIGLASVRRIVERHGGDVWARGEPGHGATFGFILPRQKEEQQ